MPRRPPFTLVSFHAHPDDEAILTAGTLARAAAEGHRVVVVTATDGGAGLTTGGRRDLGARRMDELRRAAAELGVRAVHHLGFEDSGMDGTEGAGGRAFARVPVEAAAAALAELLTAEAADVLTIYDPAGGYGHPDHVQVHRVGRAAAASAGTPVVLEATVDRRALVRGLRLVERSGLGRRLGVDPEQWGPGRFVAAYTDPGAITHRVDVRRYAAAKRRAMAAHASQAGSDEGVRTLAAFGRLPAPVFRRVFGREWFVELGRPPESPPLDDIFASLRVSGR
jgi:LmbE family N-acetylglucosaminyl deacetylase